MEVDYTVVGLNRRDVWSSFVDLSAFWCQFFIWSLREHLIGTLWLLSPHPRHRRHDLRLDRRQSKLRRASGLQCDGKSKPLAVCDLTDFPAISKHLRGSYFGRRSKNTAPTRVKRVSFERAWQERSTGATWRSVGQSVDEQRHLLCADSNLSEMYVGKSPFWYEDVNWDWLMPLSSFWVGCSPYMEPKKIGLCDLFELLVKYW